MFGLSTWELLIIVAVALIFVGPDQLPKVARTIGKGMRQVRGAMGKVDDEMRKAVREVSAELDDDGHPLREAPYRSPMAPMAEPHAPPPSGTDGTDGLAASETQGVQAVHNGVNPDTVPSPEANPTQPEGTPEVEVQTSRRGAGRTMAERDWSEVGKKPVAGQVAQAASPAVPSAAPPSASSPTAESFSAPTPAPSDRQLSSAQAELAAPESAQASPDSHTKPSA